MRFIKKELDIMRLKHNEVNFEVTFEGHPIYSKTYFMNILKCFLMNIKCSLKIYFIMSEPHNMKIIFYGLPP